MEGKCVCSSAASTVLSAVYAWDPIESKDDPLVTRINDLMHRLVRAALPGAYFVEIFPWMKYLPSWMAKWKREGLEWFRKDSMMFEGFYAGVQETMASVVSIMFYFISTNVLFSARVTINPVSLPISSRTTKETI